MIALIALVSLPPPAPAQAVATVQIVRPQSATRSDWLSGSSLHRREILVRETDGRVTRVRLIENE